MRVVVVGAGIVGVSCAIWLQRDGHQVILVDKQGPAAAASYGNGGILASCAVVPVNSPGLKRTAPGMLMRTDSPLFIRWRYLPFMLPWLMRFLRRANSRDATTTAAALTQILFDSVEQHQALARGTIAEKWLNPSDYLFIYKEKKDFDKESADWALRKKLGYRWDEMNGGQLARYDPIFKGTNKFAIRLKNHGFISDPGRYVADLAGHFEGDGGEIIIAEAADFVREGNQITAVKTATGTIPCDAVVLAAGAWSGVLAKKLGIKASLESERGYHIDLINPSVMPRAPFMLASGKFVVTPMDGRLRCAGLVEFGGLEAPPSRAPVKFLKRHIHAAIPDLAYDHVEEWMGHRPSTTDAVPLIGEIKNIKGAYAAFGHQHIGLTGGPKTGRIIADLVAGRKSNIDLAPYEVSRFTN